MALFHFSLFFHCVYVHILFTHSYDNGHLGAFHILAIVNSAAMDNVVHISFQISVFWNEPRNRNAESCGSCILGFLRNLCAVLHSGYTILHSHKKEYKSSLFSTSSLTFIIWTLFNGGHSNWFGIIPHCSFDLHLSVNYQSCASLTSVCLLWKKCLLESSAHFLDWILIFFIVLVCSCTKTVGAF